MSDQKRAQSPSEEAKEQHASGQAGGPREARGGEQGSGGQNPQGSQRNASNAADAPEAREGYTHDDAPSKQGDGDPRPQQIASGDAAQGVGNQSGSHSAQGERTTEQADRGAPKDTHARGGRQKMPGDRERE